MHELAELTAIDVQRGLDEALTEQVADQLMAKDALGALTAYTGGANIADGMWRVTFFGGGALAMAITAGVGLLFGTVA